VAAEDIFNAFAELDADGQSVPTRTRFVVRAVAGGR